MASRTYRIRAGENWFNVAQKLGVDSNQLIQSNPQLQGSLQPGNVIRTANLNTTNQMVTGGGSTTPTGPGVPTSQIGYYQQVGGGGGTGNYTPPLVPGSSWFNQTQPNNPIPPTVVNPGVPGPQPTPAPGYTPPSYTLPTGPGVPTSQIGYYQGQQQQQPPPYTGNQLPSVGRYEDLFRPDNTREMMTDIIPILFAQGIPPLSISPFQVNKYGINTGLLKEYGYTQDVYGNWIRPALAPGQPQAEEQASGGGGGRYYGGSSRTYTPAPPVPGYTGSAGAQNRGPSGAAQVRAAPIMAISPVAGRSLATGYTSTGRRLEAASQGLITWRI